MNRTTKYILPNLYLDSSLGNFLDAIKEGFVSSYIGTSKDSIYLLYDASNSNLDRDIFDVFVKSSYVKQHRPVGDIINENLVLIEIENQVTGLIDKFLKGKYSELYTESQVYKLFNYNVRKILNKEPSYRERLEIEMGVEIPHTAELDSIPEPKDEYYNHQQKSYERTILSHEDPNPVRQ